MPIENLFTRVPIWLALIGYAAAVVCLSRSQAQWAKWAWTIGCLFYLVHVLAAFQTHYHWSHKIAVNSTAAKTLELTGIKTTAGIYVNYLFTLIWIADVAWWWRHGSDRYLERRSVIRTMLQLFFLFMIFNGAVVFASGPARWLGICILLVISVNWILTQAQSRPGAR